MVKFLLVSVCLVAAAISCVSARKIPPSPLSVKYQNLNYFENDPDIVLQEDNTDKETPVNFTGDNTKAKIVNQENYQRGQGKFKYAHMTENGISVQQAGKLKDGKTFVVQGSYSYTGADGRRYRVKYTADEFGYHPITELEVDLPEPETNQNDIPDVAPFKPQFEAIRVQKQTPKPVQEVYKFRPILAATPSAAPLILGSPEEINPFGNPGPYVGNLYLPPTNDYLPPSGDETVPAGAISSGSGDFLHAPASDYYSGAAASSVFQYV